MESSLNSWEVTLFAGLFYATVVVLLTLLGYFHMLQKHEELVENGRGMHVDTYGKRVLIQRGANGSLSPYAITFLVWTVWLVIFAVNQHSVLSLIALIAAVAMLVGCVIVFVVMLKRMAAFNKLHTGPKRYDSVIHSK